MNEKQRLGFDNQKDNLSEKVSFRVTEEALEKLNEMLENSSKNNGVFFSELINLGYEEYFLKNKDKTNDDISKDLITNKSLNNSEIELLLFLFNKNVILEETLKEANIFKDIDIERLKDMKLIKGHLLWYKDNEYSDYSLESKVNNSSFKEEATFHYYSLDSLGFSYVFKYLKSKGNSITKSMTKSMEYELIELINNPPFENAIEEIHISDIYCKSLFNKNFIYIKKYPTFKIGKQIAKGSFELKLNDNPDYMVVDVYDGILLERNKDKIIEKLSILYSVFNESNAWKKYFYDIEKAPMIYLVCKNENTKAKLNALLKEEFSSYENTFNIILENDFIELLKEKL